ncbi:S1C family serine protease [Tundrisphaera sp. TA3]|uniref:S1C family serine protease n=1 Tax=Tundrisphaera sp. TA3 TaxID=3435775 RepID=UPI003EBE7399
MILRSASFWGAAFLAWATWGAPAVRGAEGPELPRAEIARRGREATAFLEFGGNRSATAFCVHPSGLFVTNDHVLRGPGAGDGAKIKVVMGSGSLEQQVFDAKVVRRDREADLALLRAESARGLPALPLGSADGLAELDEVFIFGFPFGRNQTMIVATPRNEQYPSISVNRGAISSLRRKDGRLERIQLNAAVNPGNSGGPVLNARGNVVGVVVGRVEGQFGAGIDLAIPVTILDRFLSMPEIDFAAMGHGDTAMPGESVEFRAQVASPIAGSTPPDLQLVFAAGTPQERRKPMTRAGDAYVASDVPFPATKGPRSVGVEVRYPDGSVKGNAEDIELRSGGAGVRLGRLRTLRLSPGPEAIAADGRPLDPAPEAPKELPVQVGGQRLALDLSQAREIEVTEPNADDAVSCAVVALRGKEEIGRSSLPLFLEGAPRPSFDALREGRFIRPPRSTSPISYVRVESTAGDYIGQGKSYSYGKGDLSFQMQGPALRCQIGDFGNWTLSLSAGGNRMLEAAEYRDAKRYPFSNDAPGLDFSGNGRGSNMLAGEFRIWELDMTQGQVNRIAVDFVQRSEGKMPPLVGMLRFQSTFH